MTGARRCWLAGGGTRRLRRGPRASAAASCGRGMASPAWSRSKQVTRLSTTRSTSWLMRRPRGTCTSRSGTEWRRAAVQASSKGIRAGGAGRGTSVVAEGRGRGDLEWAALVSGRAGQSMTGWASQAVATRTHLAGVWRVEVGRPQTEVGLRSSSAMVHCCDIQCPGQMTAVGCRTRLAGVPTEVEPRGTGASVCSAR